MDCQKGNQCKEAGSSSLPLCFATSQRGRLIKLEGFGNVVMAEADIPRPGRGEVLVKVKRSLIGRGSELFRRYAMDEALPSSMMGYSDAGEIVQVGLGLEGIESGRRSSLELLAL